MFLFLLLYIYLYTMESFILHEMVFYIFGNMFKFNSCKSVEIISIFIKYSNNVGKASKKMILFTLFSWVLWYKEKKTTCFYCTYFILLDYINFRINVTFIYVGFIECVKNVFSLKLQNIYFIVSPILFSFSFFDYKSLTFLYILIYNSYHPYYSQTRNLY